MTDARRQESERELAQALRAAREQIAESELVIMGYDASLRASKHANVELANDLEHTKERLATLHDNVVLLEGSKNVILAVLSAVSIVAMALAVLLILNGQRWW